jgi:hypothetical protein
VIPAYLDALSSALSFDPALARRVRAEAADHLRQAIAADGPHGGLAAQRRAIAAFGDPQAIAAQFVAAALARRTAKLRVALVLAVASVFVAMKGRVAWYAASGFDTGHGVSPATRIIAAIDRYAFWSSVIIAVGAFAYLAARPVAPIVHRGLRRQVRQVRLLAMAATAALALAVLSDGLLTAIKMMGAEMSAGSLVPIATMAIEIACIGIVLLELASTRLRGAPTIGPSAHS